MKEYDVCVIGAGSAGLVASTTANRLGAKTILIENDKLGGECLHSGCVPSKAFIHSSKIFNELQLSKNIGLPEMKVNPVDMSAIMQYVHKTINDIYIFESKENFTAMGIDVEIGSGQFVTKNEFKINNKIIKSKFFIICTGSSPMLPPLEGLINIPYLTNQNFWDIKKLPEHIAILGAGPIAIELGQALTRLGSKVNIMIRSEQILKKEDIEISSAMEKFLIEEGITFNKKTSIKKFEKFDNKIKINYTINDTQKELLVDAVFVATGRRPNLNQLNLEGIGVEINKKGIITDDYLQTNIDNIYGAGDVIGKYMFTHSASYYAEIAVQNILKENKISIKKSVMPWVTYTDPEIAHVGMTDSEAQAQGIKINVLKVNCDLDRFRTENSTKGFVKIILDQNDKIIGGHAIGAHSGEFIQNITLAMQNNLSIQQIVDTIYPYPTFSEIIKKAFMRYMRTKV